MYVSDFTLQVENYLMVFCFSFCFFFKEVKLEVLKPTDPGKCAQPVLLKGEGKKRGENEFAGSVWFCVLVLLLHSQEFCSRSSRPQYSLLSSQQLNNSA